MIQILLIAAASLGLSEHIESRLPADPEMIYTVSFEYNGSKVGLDWKDGAVVPDRVCRKTSEPAKQSCQTAALGWLNAECAFYEAKSGKSAAQQRMQQAVCSGATDLQSMLQARQLAER